MRKYLNLRTNIALGLVFAFLANIFGPLPVYAQDFRLPAPGVMVRLSPEFNPPILKGLKVHPDNPFRFDFILDQGDSNSVIPAKAGIQNQEQLKTEATKLIKYFLASLTIPEKDLWVNLSPYEKDRIIPNSFGLTEMGRDLLAEDYMLKQITASLIYPEDAIGKKFWKRIYEEAAKKFGTTNIPVNTFNKVWIVPEKAVVYENAKAGTAYVVESKLKVMLEQDYLALEKNQRQPVTNALGSKIVREIVIPELTKEVNEGKNFAQLRQVYNSLILATWYKKKIKDSILSQVYADKSKTVGVQYTSTVIPAKAGIQINDVELIYQQYLQAFKKGVYNYIKEDIDPITQHTIPRKYFSGGITDLAMNIEIKPVSTEVLYQEMAQRHLDIVNATVKDYQSRKLRGHEDAVMAGNSEHLLVPGAVVHYDEEKNLKGVKSHKERIVDLLRQLQGEMPSGLEDKSRMIDRLFGEGNEKTAQALVELASLLRTNFYYKINNSDPRPPLRYGIEEKIFFKIGPNLYLSPTTESFKRHLIFKTDDSGRVEFVVELMIPGESRFRRGFKAKKRKIIAEEINSTFKKEYSVSVLFERDLDYQVKTLYGHVQRNTIEVLVYDYPLDGKRLTHVTEAVRKEWAKSMGVSLLDLDRKVMKQAVECFWAVKLAGYTSRGDFHTENLRVGPIYNQKGKMVDVKVELVADYQMMYESFEKYFTVIAGAAIYGVGRSYDVHFLSTMGSLMLGFSLPAFTLFDDYHEMFFSLYSPAKGLVHMTSLSFKEIYKIYREAKESVRAQMIDKVKAREKAPTMSVLNVRDPYKVGKDAAMSVSIIRKAMGRQMGFKGYTAGKDFIETAAGIAQKILTEPPGRVETSKKEPYKGNIDEVATEIQAIGTGHLPESSIRIIRLLSEMVGEYPDLKNITGLDMYLSGQKIPTLKIIYEIFGVYKGTVNVAQMLSARKTALMDTMEGGVQGPVEKSAWNDLVFMLLGNPLRTLRERSGMTIQQASKNVVEPEHGLQEIENGQILPSEDKLVDLLLGVYRSYRDKLQNFVEVKDILEEERSLEEFIKRPNSPFIEFGREIHKLRLERGLTIKDVAYFIPRAPNTRALTDSDIMSIEKGQVLPSPRVINGLIVLLGLNEDEKEHLKVIEGHMTAIAEAAKPLDKGDVEVLLNYLNEIIISKKREYSQDEDAYRAALKAIAELVYTDEMPVDFLLKYDDNYSGEPIEHIILETINENISDRKFNSFRDYFNQVVLPPESTPMPPQAQAWQGPTGLPGDILKKSPAFRVAILGNSNNRFLDSKECQADLNSGVFDKQLQMLFRKINDGSETGKRFYVYYGNVYQLVNEHRKRSMFVKYFPDNKTFVILVYAPKTTIHARGDQYDHSVDFNNYMYKLIPLHSKFSSLQTDLIFVDRDFAMTTNEDEEAAMTGVVRKPIILQGGADVLTAMNWKDVDTTKTFMVGRDGDGHLISLRRQGAEIFPQINTSFATLNEKLGIMQHIEELAQKRGNKSTPIIVLDWGCGTGRGLIELQKEIRERRIKNVILYGYDIRYYPNWDKTPKGIHFILDTMDNLKDYLSQVNFIYDNLGLISLSNDQIKFHFRDLHDLLDQSTGEIRTWPSSRRGILLDEAKDRWGELYDRGIIDQNLFYAPQIIGQGRARFIIIKPKPKARDRAMITKGGIDLTPAKMNLQGNDTIQFHLDPAMLQQLQNAPGFVPVIINIQPMTDLKLFLGVVDNQ